MFENPRRGRQARNFTTNAPKILDLKSSSEQIFSRKLALGAPGKKSLVDERIQLFARLSNVATTGERDNEINISGLDNYSICQSSDTEELWFHGEKR